MDEIEIVEMARSNVLRWLHMTTGNKICWIGHLITWKHLEAQALRHLGNRYTTGGGTGFGNNQVQARPLGGDQEVGSLIANNGVDILVFFWDPLEPMPHDPDVKALLRIAVVWNVVVVSDKATADFVVSSPFFQKRYPRLVRKYEY